MRRPLLVVASLVLGGCIEIPILASETVRTPQPRPACGETGRRYTPPTPRPVSAPASAAPIAAARPVPR